MPSPLRMLTALRCLLQDEKCQRQSVAHPRSNPSNPVQLQKWEKSRGPVYKEAIDHFFSHSSSSSPFPPPTNLDRLLSPTIIFASG